MPIELPTMKRRATYETLFWMICLGLNLFILSKGLSGQIVKVAPVAMPRAITHCKVDTYKVDDKVTERSMRPPNEAGDSLEFELKLF